MNAPTGTAEAANLMQQQVRQQHPLAAVVGRHVHFWASEARPQHVRHDEQPFAAVIAFVHPDGDVTVHGFDHYGASFAETHVPLRDADGNEHHGSTAPRAAYCTWPVTK